MIASPAFAEGTFTVKTGFGYFEDDNGNIISKAELPKGEHPLKDGFTYVEVKDRSKLDEVTIPEPTPTQEELDEVKIQNKIRELAISDLKSSGDLPANFTDKRKRK